MLIGYTTNTKRPEEYLYVIKNQTKYSAEVERIENVEDAEDDFYTYDEVQAIVGERFNLYGSNVKTDLLKQDIEALVSTMKSEGKRSILIDEDIMSILQDDVHGSFPVSRLVKGVRRLGNKLMLHETVKVSKPNKPLLRTLVNIATWKIRRKYKVEFKLTNIHTSYSGTLNVIKSLIEWEDIFSLNEQELAAKHEGWYVREIRNLKEDELISIKHIWDNPTMFDTEEKS